MSTQRKCDGYEDVSNETSWLEVHQKAGTQLALALLSNVQRQPTIPTWPIGVHYSREAVELFDYFRTNLVAQFAGSFDENFWTKSILQATALHPAVWHACNALAAVSRSYKLISDAKHMSKTGRRDPDTAIAIRQYSLSVRCLVQIVSKSDLSLTDKEILLVTNMLFIILCRLRADMKEAYVHLYNGLKLFSQWGFAEKIHSPDRNESDSLLSLNSLRPVFLRMYYQTAPIREWENESWNKQYCINEILPIPFLNATDAFFEVELLCHSLRMDNQLMSDFSKPASIGPPKNSRQAIWASFRLWKSKYANFKRSRRFKEAKESSIIIIDIYEVLLDVMSKIDYADILSVDKFESSYRVIIGLAEKLGGLEATNGEDNPTQKMPVRQFAVTPAVCDAMYHVVYWSRNPLVRRRAIHILDSRKRDECMIGPEVQAWVCRSNMYFEERVWHDASLALETPGCNCRANEFICRFHRIIDTSVRFDDEFQFRHRIKTVYDVENDLPGTEITLSTRDIDTACAGLKSYLASIPSYSARLGTSCTIMPFTERK